MMRLEGTQGFEGLADADKVLVRSNGTATYVAKDIAYQMWKFGRSAIDFRYTPHEGPREGLWSTTSTAGTAPPRQFGHAARVYNVIDVRQSYLQDVVSRSLEALGLSEQARNSVHYAYEMVALTPRCAEEMGFQLEAEDRKRPFVEMSGRKGLGIKADDLIDHLTRRAAAEVKAHHAEMADGEVQVLARSIAVGALRYFMLRFGRLKIVAFDFEEALRFQGETGPYLQNSMVRSASIFRKAAERGEADAAPERLDPERDLTDLSELEREDEPWSLVLALARLDEILALAVSTLELSLVARWAFETAQVFHKYYERFRILGEPDAARRRERAALVWLYQARMRRALEVMGIPVPERM
jgi:arginyl-tRNA synthetase